MKFVDKNSILKKINELTNSPKESRIWIFGSHEFNEFGEWVTWRGWDGTNKNWASPKKNYRREDGSSSFDSLNSWLIILKIREQKKILDITIGDCLTN